MNLEGFLLIDDHAKEPVDADGNKLKDVEPFHATASLDENDPDAHFKLKEKLPLTQRDITSMLIRTDGQLAALGLSRMINKGKDAQAAYPTEEIANLFSNIVTPIQSGLLVLTLLICVVSGISILVSIYNSMNDRRKEIAVMRSLGAGRRTVMTVILLESIMLALGGGILGWIGGHALIGIASGSIEDSTGVVMSPFDLTPNLLASYTDNPIVRALPPIPTELLLVPFLIVLAVLVGFLPALSAYKTDVAKSLTS